MMKNNEKTKKNNNDYIVFILASIFSIIVLENDKIFVRGEIKICINDSSLEHECGHSQIIKC
jgi:hypothetical protein